MATPASDLHSYPTICIHLRSFVYHTVIIYTYIRTYVHTYIHTYKIIYIYICIYICILCIPMLQWCVCVCRRLARTQNYLWERWIHLVSSAGRGSERIRHRQFELALCTPWMNGYGKSTYEMMDGQIDGRTHAHIHCFIVCIYIYIKCIYIYIQRYIYIYILNVFIIYIYILRVFLKSIFYIFDFYMYIYIYS